MKDVTVMSVVHRERYPILNAQGGITRVVEEEWHEPADVHAKHRDAIAAVARQGYDDLQAAMTFAKADIDRLDAERQREHERVVDLERQLAIVDALRRDEKAAFERRLAEYAAAARAAASKEVLMALPAHLVDLAGLRDAEREIRAMRWAPDPAPDRVLWFVADPIT